MDIYSFSVIKRFKKPFWPGMMQLTYHFTVHIYTKVPLKMHSDGAFAILAALESARKAPMVCTKLKNTVPANL